MSDDADNCPSTGNGNQNDDDGDGEGDVCDPIADATGFDTDEPYIEDCDGPQGATVQLDGSGSYDPNGTLESFKWEIGSESSTDEQPRLPLSFGTHLVELTVTDNDGMTDHDMTAVTIDDKQGPDLACPEDVIIECSGYDGASATFDASASDQCDDAVAAVCSPASGTVFALGTSSPHCFASDDSGNRSGCSFDVRIVDNTAPIITGIAEPIHRWPPDNKFENFTVGDFVDGVADICAELTLDDLRITQVTVMGGDGGTTEGVVVAPDGQSVDLRIGYSAGQAPLTYTVEITAQDPSGNSTAEFFEVMVSKIK